MRIESGPPLLRGDGTVATLFFDAARKYAREPAFVWRAKDGTTSTITYEEVERRVRAIAAGLAATGIAPGDRVGLLADTRPEWGLVDLAIQVAGAVTVTVFTTLAPEQVAFQLEDARAKLVFVDNAAQMAKLRRCGSSLPLVETIVAFEPQPATDDSIGKRAITLSEIEARGADKPGYRERKPTDESTIIYTSGTTGIPKGAVLTHRNCVAAARQPTQAFGLDQFPGQRSTVVFLPLAHSLTRAIFLNAIDLGARIGFGAPKTLIEDLKVIEPRLIASAPRIYERIYDQFMLTASNAKPFEKKIMLRARDAAIAYGEAVQDGHRASPWLSAKRAFYDRLVYRKIRAKLGFTQLEMALSGAAAIRPDLLHFFRGVGIVIVEAWGLTETSAPGTTNPIERVRPGTVGRPFPGVSIALADDGEILVSGPNVFAGYHARPDENKEAFVELEGHRWFRTGDIGRFDEAGYLQIIDRKKELEVLDTGKKIAPITVEETLKTVSPFVAEACLIGTGRKYAAALVQPNFDRLVAWAREQKIPFNEGSLVVKPDPTGAPMTYTVGQDLLDNPRVQTLFDSEIGKCNAKVADFERIRAFRLVPNVFSMDRDELTVKLSKKRRVIHEHYRDLIESMYR